MHHENLSFTDVEGREWPIVFSLGALRRVRKATRIDIADPSKFKNLAQLLGDREKLAQALWAVVEKQAEADDVDEDSFFDSLSGATLDAASLAISEAYVLFCPEKCHEALRVALSKQAEAADLMADAIVAEFQSEKTDDEIAHAIKGAVGEAFSNFKTELQKIGS